MGRVGVGPGMGGETRRVGLNGEKKSLWPWTIATRGENLF